jgi:hypothetical protein
MLTKIVRIVDIIVWTAYVAQLPQPDFIISDYYSLDKWSIIVSMKVGLWDHVRAEHELWYNEHFAPYVISIIDLCLPIPSLAADDNGNHNLVGDGEGVNDGMAG